MRRHSAGSNCPTLNRARSLPSISATRARRNFGKQSLRGDKGGGDDEYSFDGNGRLTYDPNKGVEVSYDLTGVPSTVIIGDVLNSYTYSADGVKQRVYSHFYGHMAPLALDAVPMGRGPLDGGGQVGPGTGNDFSVFRDTRYCGPFVLESDTLSKVLFPGGFCTMSGGQPTFHYYVRNHRGDNCGVVSDSGVFEQKTFYYPFGGIRGDVSTTPSLQPYKHSGKEWDHLGGLDWYDYGARMYDPALGMWTSGDPLAEKSPHMSIYSFCGNDPVNSFDPDGRKFEWVESQHSREIYDQVQALRQTSEVFNTLYTYMDELDDVYYIYVDDEDIQQSIKKQSGNSDASAKGYFDTVNNIFFSEKIADIGTFTEEIFHAYQYRYYGNSRETHELDAEAKLLSTIVDLEQKSSCKGIACILDMINNLGYKNIISIPVVLYFFSEKNGLLIPPNSSIEEAYFNSLFDFSLSHESESSVYRGKQRPLHPNAYNSIIKMIK